MKSYYCDELRAACGVARASLSDVITIQVFSQLYISDNLLLCEPSLQCNAMLEKYRHKETFAFAGFWGKPVFFVFVYSLGRSLT